jgi:hypothetical protein
MWLSKFLIKQFPAPEVNIDDNHTHTSSPYPDDGNVMLYATNE